MLLTPRRSARWHHAVALVILCATGIAGAAWAAEAKGWFGLEVSVDAEGISLNPTLRSVRIEKVSPASPAASAGLASGDWIVEIQGIVVAGAKADALKTAMHKTVGEVLHMKVKHGNGDAREVALTAAAQPAGH